MKQCTDELQTAKLIELGFEKPKGWYVDGVTNHIKLYVNIDENPMMFNYSIGELIEMLDSVNETIHCRFGGVKANLVSTNSGYEKIGGELIDLLFDLCVKLKDEK